MKHSNFRSPRALRSIGAALVSAASLLGALTLTAPALGAQVPSSGEVTMLRLLDGRILWGQIEDHSAEDVSFLRLDTGGRVRLPWRMIDPEQGLEFQTAWGYIETSDEEILMDAERLIVGGKEIVGLIVNRTDNEIYVKQRGQLLAIPKLRVEGTLTTVQVPVLDIYTPEELYADELLRVRPSTGDEHLEMARFCERIDEFALALEHYDQVADLGTSEEDFDLQSAIDRNRVKSENKAQLDALRDIESLRRRGYYDQAIAQAEAFPEVYEDSPFIADAQKRLEKVKRARTEDLRREVQRAWYRRASRLAREHAKDDYETVLGYLEGEMSEEILRAVVQDVQKSVSKSAEEDEVLKLWRDRDRGLFRQTASYGNGTWLLGQDRARAGGKGAESERREPRSEREAERQAIEDKIAKYLKNQQVSRQGRQTSAVEAEDENLAWKKLGFNERHLWVLAYYAENSGDMEVDEVVRFKNCPTCAGRGVIEVIYTGGAVTGGRGAELQLETCQTCRGVGIVRRIRFR